MRVAGVAMKQKVSDVWLVFLHNIMFNISKNCITATRVEQFLVALSGI
jgi:hypothetical protein